MLSSTFLTLFLVPVMYTLLVRRVRPMIDIEEEMNAPLAGEGVTS
jgi:hypothetical protein